MQAWFQFLWCFFLKTFLAQFSRHLVLLGVLGLVAGILFLNLGGSFGLPLLFWHENAFKAILAGIAVILLVGKVLFNAFLLDTKLGDQRQWLALIPANRWQPGGQRDSVTEAAFYLIGATASLLAIGVLGAVIWLIGLFISWVQTPSGQSTATMATIHPPAYSYILFLVGAVIGTGFVVGIFIGTAKLIRVFRGTDPGSIFDFLLGLKSIQDPTTKAQHITAAVFTVGLALLYIFNAIWLPNWLGTPAMGICTLLGLATAVYSYIAFRVANPSAILLVGVAFLLLGGIPQYKLQFNTLNDCYPKSSLVKLAGYPLAKPSGLFRDTDPTWTAAGKRRPLVLVCVSGGGIRASVWSAEVMQALEQQFPDFPYHVRVICGASGGMVGMSYYTATLVDPKSSTNGHLHGAAVDLGADLGKDALSKPVKQMLFRDIPMMFLPGDNLNDRGEALEAQWQQYWGPAGDKTFQELRAGEEAGWRPSLIVSPMLIEDGRRLLMSNLDLEFMTVNNGNRLDNPNKNFFSQSSYEFSRLFPKDWPNLPLRTAARMNASFPYVTPTAELPTLPRRRVADAGYYDNYGVSVAGAWLTEYLSTPAKTDWLRKQVSGVIVVQIRDAVSVLDEKNSSVSVENGSPADRGFEWATSPMTGLFSGRDSVAQFRNDSELGRITQLFAESNFPADYFTTATFEYNGDASLSWYLTAAEQQNLHDAAAAFIKTPQMVSLKKWWSSK